VAVIRSNVASHRFGTSLTAGCFSSSGAEDLVVGSNVAAGAQATFGEVRVFGASSLSGAVSAVTGAQSRVYGGAGVRLGAAVLVADLDGDGAGELIASSPTTGSQRGKVYAIPCASLPTGGASASIANLPAATFSETVANRNLGASLAAGDVDRDGVDELIAGAPGFGATSATDGAARVLELVAGALSPMGLVTGRTGKEGAHGAALAVGDCNGDGWDDVVVGARKENVDEPVPPGGLATLAEGQVYLYLGGSADTEDVVTRYVDLDEDGFGTTAVEVCPSELGANDAAVDGDCDDAAAAINPTATEVCDGIDNNCDGQKDEGCADAGGGAGGGSGDRGCATGGERALVAGWWAALLVAVRRRR
jgi:hypothetical protein